MTKEEIIKNFNPNDPGSSDAGIFGLPFSCEQSDIVLVPVPWQATVSYGAGTADGPEAIRESSLQMDLRHYDYPDLWKRGIAMDEIPAAIKALSDETRKHSEKIIAALEQGQDPRNDEQYAQLYETIDASCEKMNQWVQERTSYWMDKDKMVGLVGGDHSTPLGYLRAQSDRHDSFGLLVIDAHMDLRQAYEGFTFSHASVFYNALQLPQVSRLVEVGIRDYCEEEDVYAAEQGDRVKIYFDKYLQRQSMSGVSWSEIFRKVIDQLPAKVYVSVDIDGLDPQLCPNTGTPVPGGLQFEQLMYLLKLLEESGKQVIGFDLCEVAPGDNDWDGNVGARVLYQLCGMAAKFD